MQFILDFKVVYYRITKFYKFDLVLAQRKSKSSHEKLLYFYCTSVLPNVTREYVLPGKITPFL